MRSIRFKLAYFLEGLALRIGIGIHMHKCGGVEAECPCWWNGYENARNR